MHNVFYFTPTISLHISFQTLKLLQCAMQVFHYCISYVVARWSTSSDWLFRLYATSSITDCRIELERRLPPCYSNLRSNIFLSWLEIDLWPVDKLYDNHCHKTLKIAQTTMGSFSPREAKMCLQLVYVLIQTNKQKNQNEIRNHMANTASTSQVCQEKINSVPYAILVVSPGL